MLAARYKCISQNNSIVMTRADDSQDSRSYLRSAHLNPHNLSISHASWTASGIVFKAEQSIP
jgi:hypothetical protein